MIFWYYKTILSNKNCENQSITLFNAEEPFSQPPDNNKDGRKDVFNLTVGGQRVSTQQSFGTFTPQGSSSTGPQVVIEQRNYDKSAYQQAASSVSSRRPQGGPQSQTILQMNRQTSIPPPEDLDDQQNGKLSFRARAPFNKIPGNNRIAKMKFLKNQLYKDYDIVKITTIYQKKDKENLFQIEFDNQDQYDKFINAEFKFMENDEPMKFQIKDDSDKIEKTKEKEAQKSRMIQILDIPLNYKPYEIRAVFSKYGKIEDLYTRVKGLYQHAYIRYEQEDDINVFYSQWSCYLEQHTVRVIPLLLNDESRENRYGFALKLTGLPFGTTGREVNELLKGSGAKSVVIPRNPKNYNLLKYAMVYFPDEDVLTEAASLELKIKGSVLFWLNLDEKACHACGSPEHIAKDCDKERQIKPKYLNRTQTLSQFKQKKSSSYADITRGGSNNRRRQQSHSNNNRKEWNEKILSTTTHIWTIHSNSKDNKALREEFTACRNKQQTKQQQQYKSILKNDNQKSKEKAATSLNNNTKEFISKILDRHLIQEWTIQQKNTTKKEKKKKFYPASPEINIYTNKQNNNSFENKKSKNPQSYPYLNIATLNVRGLTIEKRQFILDLLEEKRINILGISETSLKNSEAKFIYKNITSDYISYFTNLKDEDHVGSGTGIIVSRSLDAHIFNSMEYKGRIITLDFQFKGNLKIRIIQCYLPASSHAISVQNDYVNEIKRLIGEAKRKNYEIIMMGDLNNHYDSFLKRKQKGQQIRSKHRIFEYLENISMFDTTNLLFDISEANSRHTFHGNSNNKATSSRIDYIWTSHFLALQLNNQKLYKPNDIKTDHLMILNQFFAQEIVGLKQLAKLKQQRRWKMIYAYDEMTDEDWLAYKMKQQNFL
ncbi:unnamed protein product [Rhizophagus irregularis]|nr:unnamed protein product [Rhizophagus irregularis]